MSEGGLEALSVRRLASAIGATTQAVYSLFGSKDGLVIALGTRPFNLLNDGLDSLPTSGDPAGDLVEAGVVVFRRFTLSHLALFMIGFLQTSVLGEIAREFRSAQENALARLHAKIRRLKHVGRLGLRSEPQAALEFHALCEGLAALEDRCILRPEEAEHVWRDALRALAAFGNDDKQEQQFTPTNMAPSAAGKIWISSKASAVALYLKSLPPLPQGQVYQLWLEQSGQVINVGTFEVNQEGRAWKLFQPEQLESPVQRVFITLEPVGGSLRLMGPELLQESVSAPKTG